MNSRERILAIATGTVVLAILLYLGVNKLVLERAGALDAKAAELEAEATRLKSENAREDAHRRNLKELVARTFGDEESRASEEVRSHLADLLQASGLGMDSLSLQPVMGRRVPGVYREIGWVVRSRGRLQSVVNFVYLLQADPHVHRMDNVILTPNVRTGEIEIQVKYATLLLESPEAKKLLAAGPREPLPVVAVDGPGRRPYDVIVVRDLFRPYLQRQPTQVAVGAGTPSYVRPTETTGSADDRYRVVGLPAYGTRQQIYVRDAATGQTRAYKAGDAFGDGSIVMVDYRMRPLPDRPHILSGSRVIFQVGQEFWAVELGCSLAEKHLLALEDLPASLRPAGEAPAPALPAPQAAPAATSPAAPAAPAAEAAAPPAREPEATAPPVPAVEGPAPEATVPEAAAPEASEPAVPEAPEPEPPATAEEDRLPDDSGGP